MEQTFLSSWKVFNSIGVPVGEFCVFITDYADEVSLQFVQKTFELWCISQGLDPSLLNYSVK